jgi:hypothetical protein
LAVEGKNSPEKAISAEIFLNINSQMEAFSKCCLLDFDLMYRHANESNI